MCFTLGDIGIVILAIIRVTLAFGVHYVMVIYLVILTLILVLLFYIVILFSGSSIFSIGLFYMSLCLLSDNFECGFYPILISMLKYKLNYWILTIYFLIFEQELIFILLLNSRCSSLNENIILWFLLSILFLDLFY